MRTGVLLGALGKIRERFFGVVPRTHVFGDGKACDGCDRQVVLTRLKNGGYYCSQCAEGVAG